MMAKGIMIGTGNSNRTKILRLIKEGQDLVREYIDQRERCLTPEFRLKLSEVLREFRIALIREIKYARPVQFVSDELSFLSYLIELGRRKSGLSRNEYVNDRRSGRSLDPIETQSEFQTRAAVRRLTDVFSSR